MSTSELSPALADPSGGVLPRLELEHVVSAHYRYGTGRNPYRTGYGAKIPTEYRLMCRGPLEAANGAPYRQRRVYVACYGNAGSAYVLVNGTPHYLTPDVEKLMVAARQSDHGRAVRPGDAVRPSAVPIAGVPRADVQAAIDTWDRVSEGDSGDAEIDAAVDMRDMLEAMLNHGA